MVFEVFAARTSARRRETAPINFFKFGLSRRLFPIKKTNTSIGSTVEAWIDIATSSP